MRGNIGREFRAMSNTMRLRKSRPIFPLIYTYNIITTFSASFNDSNVSLTTVFHSKICVQNSNHEEHLLLQLHAIMSLSDSETPYGGGTEYKPFRHISRDRKIRFVFSFAFFFSCSVFFFRSPIVSQRNVGLELETWL